MKTTPDVAKTIPEKAKRIGEDDHGVDSQESGCQDDQEVADHDSTGSHSTDQTGHLGATSGSGGLVDQECLTGQHGVVQLDNSDQSDDQQVGTSGVVQYTVPPTDQPETRCRSTTPSPRSTCKSMKISTLLEYWDKKEEVNFDLRPSI